jgi:hypothetical protein
VASAVAQVGKLKMAEGVFLQVSSEGVRIIESLSHEVMSSYTMKDVTFTSVAGKGGDIFAFVQKDDGLGTINCHMFKCAGERAYDITTSFRDAFTAFAEEQKKLGGNPFQPHGEREAPPGDLARKQVRRDDLVAIKPIGAGQFGQVFLANQAVAPGEGERIFFQLFRPVSPSTHAGRSQGWTGPTRGSGR